MPFMLAELLELSGMITIFFTGIFARRYMEPNVSEETGEYARILFRLLAFLAEICIFLELGLSVCGMHKGHFSWVFVSWAFVAALLGRAVGVYPLSFLYNLSLTRPIDTVMAKTIAVEMIAKGKCTDCTLAELTQDNGSNAMDDHQFVGNEENVFADEETQRVDNSTLGFNGMTSEIKGETERMERIAAANQHSFLEEKIDVSIEGISTSISNTTSADASVMSTSYYELMPTVVSQRETPQRKLDKVIPLKFMHLLWFAGLRGAVAYACAREFPDVYGHRDEFIAATMVIVVITIVLMGGATEPLMERLGVRMNVDNAEYMRAWHQERKLKGRFLHFEYHWIYRFVVKDESLRLMDESCGHIERVDDRNAEDDVISRFISGRSLGTASTPKPQKDKERKFNGGGRYGRSKGYHHRQLSRKDIVGFDSSTLMDEAVKNRSLFDEQEDEEDSCVNHRGSFTSLEIEETNSN
mmetsp:Transcript_205/g.344  ORF Transcript_205/g.344 Transcript_205/m.344 type:complete len:469 (-) Transcript_205:2244-3650(-)